MFSEWRELPLGDVVTLKRGYDLPAGERNHSGRVPIVSSSGISGYHDSAVVKAPGVVTGRYGSIGNFFYLTEDFWPLNTSLYVQDFKGNHPHFIYYLLQILNFAQYSDKTSVPGVNRNDLHRIKVNVPSLNEQHKLADILSTWDEAIALIEQLIAAKQQRKQALMQRLLTGQVRFPGFEEEWKEVTLVELTKSNRYSFTGGPFGSNLKAQDYTDVGVRIIQLQNIGDGEFLNNYKLYTSESKADELLSCNIYPGEIILAKMGDPVARATIIPTFHDRYLMASDGIRLEVDDTKYDTKFVLEAINSPEFRKKAISQSTGSTRQRISLSDLKMLTIKAPELHEQKKIAMILSTCDEEVILLQQKLTTLRQQKQGLMQQLLTGKIRVKV